MFMINEVIFFEMTIYIAALLLAFHIKTKNKNIHNNRYKAYKNWLYLLIFIIFLYSLSVFFLASLLYKPFWIILSINFIFIMYMLGNMFKETRCWKQHRMIYYNFLLLPAIYYSSLLLLEPQVNLIWFVIILYTLLEFQFAKFDMKQTLMWD